MASVAKHIRRLRTGRHMTQEELAEKLFVTRQAVSAWETGKSQPDLETLERIAAALGVEVTELIYGAPQSPNLRKLKQRWAVIGGTCVMILAVLLIMVLKNGAYGTWRYGLSYQWVDSNYRIAYEEIPGGCSEELDLNDLESNVGKVLYQDDTGCRILVDSVDENRQGKYRVWFRAYGVYGRSGGTLVSGCQTTSVEKTSWTLDMSSSHDCHCGRRGIPLHPGRGQRTHLPRRQQLRLPPQSPGGRHWGACVYRGAGSADCDRLRPLPLFHRADLLLGYLLIFQRFSSESIDKPQNR